MYIRCGKCGSPVYLDARSVGTLYLTFGLGKKGITVGRGDFKLLPPDERKPIFYCVECKKEVPLKNIVFTCMECGRDFSANEGGRPAGSNGVYCEEHAIEFREVHGQTINQLELIMSRVEV